MTKVLVHLLGYALLLSLNLLTYSAKASPELSCGTTITSFPYTESFESSLGDWSSVGPSYLWGRDSGGTPSASTGPSTGADGSYYVYVESSGNGTGYPNKEANLEGPCFDLSSALSADFEFSYHMYGSTMGSLALQISTDGGTTWATLWSRTNDQDNTWYPAEIELDAFVGQVVKFRFHAITGIGFLSDMAIDDITLSINTTPPSLSCSSTISSFPYSEGFELNPNSWSQETGTAFWSRHTGGTISSETGPSSADEGSYYQYVEATGYNPYKVARISSPCFDLTQESEASFSFSYHMYGADMGDLKLQIATDDNPNWQTIWMRSGSHADRWYKAEVDLGAYVGKTVKFQFEGTTGDGYKSDMAIDDITVNASAVQYTAGCSTIISDFPYTESFESGPGAWVDTASISKWIRNAGGTPTSGTGPGAAQSGSYYMYSEGSNTDSTDFSSYLLGPCFDLSYASSASLNFYYHLNHNTADPLEAGLSLEISLNSGATWNSIWAVNGNQGSSWQLAELDLSTYTGQTIMLRFHSFHDYVYANDTAIDNIQIYAPETPIAGAVQATIEFPQTTACNDASENYCCSPGTITGLPIPNVGIDMTGINGNKINTVSDGTGTFAQDLPGGAITLAPFVNTSDWSNGISISDVIAIANHVSGSKLINCPLQRLAADVDNDGDIDSDDQTLISNMNTGSILDFPGDNWRFIPKTTVIPNDLHSDGRFLADFWNSAKQDNNGSQYPFKAVLGLVDGSSFDYNGTSSWLNSLHSFLNTNCNTTDYGFYAVKSGDINGTAVYNNFSDPYGPAAAQSGQVMAINDPNQTRANEIKVNRTATLRSGEDKKNKYQVKIVAQAPETIIGYQMAVTFDDENISLDKINPNKEELNQSIDKNFGQAKKTLRGGSFVTQWVTDFEKKPEGENFQNIVLLSAEFKSDLSLESVESAYRIDNAVKELLFFGVNGPIIEVDLQIFVEPIK